MTTAADAARRPRRTARPPRRQPRPRPDEPTSDRRGRRGRRPTRPTDDGRRRDAAEAERRAGDDDREDDAGGGRRRRRRGGRRRRKSGDGEDDADGDGDSADETDDAEADAAGRRRRRRRAGEGTSRRRRRRRRAGDDGDGDAGDDPQNTVTRVRKARNAEDEITAVSGSTRLEAKKQRRREGREAGRRRAPIVSEAEFLARRESVERVMVIRQRDDLTQIGVLEDKVLVEHYVARESQTSLIGNVYLGRVQNVLPSMEAAFVDIGKGRNAVLYAGEVNWSALGHKDGQPRKIESVLSSGPADPGAGHQGPDRPQGRPAHQPGQPGRPVPGLRARRHHQRHLPQAARHRAQPPQDAAQGDRPRHRRRHRAHRRRGRQRGRADPRRRAAQGPLGGHREEGQGQRPAAALRRARPDPQGRPRPVHRGLRQAGHPGRRRLGDRPGATSPTWRPTSRTRLERYEPERRRQATSSRRTGSTSRSPRASTARSGCPRAARWSSTAPRR